MPLMFTFVIDVALKSGEHRLLKGWVIEPDIETAKDVAVRPYIAAATKLFTEEDVAEIVLNDIWSMELPEHGMLAMFTYPEGLSLPDYVAMGWPAKARQRRYGNSA